jgi:hypothetical protein
MKADNYLCTMTEIKSMGFPYLFPGSPPADSNYCLTKTVFGINFLYNFYWSSSTMNFYTDDRLPRYQDFLQVKLIINATKAPLSTPSYNTLFYYQITVNVDGSAPPGPAADIRITDTLPTGMTLLDFAYVYANGSSVPNPTSNYYTVNTFQSNTASGAFDISLKPGIYTVNRPTPDSFSPITIGFTAKATTTGSLTNTAYATIPSGAFTYQTSGSNTINIAATTTTTTTRAATTTTTTTTCNPTPNWQNTGFNCYGGCNKYNVQTDQNPCSPTYNTTRQGSLVESNSTYCGGCCGQSTAANWVNNGAQFCSGCTLYQPEIDNNPCSPTYNQTRNVSLGISNNCGSWNISYYCQGCAYYSKETNSCTGDIRNITLISSNSNNCGTWNISYYCTGCAYYSKETNSCTGDIQNVTLINGNSTNCGGCCGQSTTQTWVNTGNYNCYSTCNKYNVEIQNNPCASGYNTTRQGSVVEYGSTFCGGCCGQSTAANWVNSGSYNCYGSCTKYNVEVDNNGCSPTYNQTRQGSAVEFNSSFCGGCCGTSPSANWVNNGDTFCDGCYLQQPQIDNNPCSSTYGQTRNVDLGVNTACGTWVQSFYCVGYNKWTKETNSCTGNIRNNYEVEANSPYCGYVPPSCGIVWYFYNSSDTPPPLSEAFAYIGCDGESHYVYVYAGDTTTACVLKGTTPGTGSEGDNPYTFGNECNG